MSTYPGNPSLGDEVKQRILATYQQSVGLAESGRHQEAILGCDFVLELDPDFDPARTLKDRLNAPASPSATAAGGGNDEDDPFDFDALPELPDLEPLEEASGREEAAEDLFDFEAPAIASAPAAEAAPADLADRLRRSFDARDFRAVVETASKETQALAADPEAARLAESAQAKLEAQPYVESFLREAGKALRAGEVDRADAQLAKVRSLDPEHPLYQDLAARLRAARGETTAGADAAPAAAPDGSVPPAGETDDAELLDGFEMPDLSDSDGGSAWSSASGDEDSDPFSLDGLDTPELDSARPNARTSEGDARIAELLEEGDRAAAESDYQGAIDAWSRIFLIDVDHDEAARRIEAARRQKAEREREIEEAFHEGLGALEAGEREDARGHFERVLAMQPSHLAARDYLRQIESGEPVTVAKGPSPDETIAMGGLGTFDLSDLSTGKAGSVDAELREEILVPPPPGAAPAGDEPAAESPAGLPSYGPARARREPGRRSFLLVGGVVLVLVLAGAWWLFSNKDSVFPNSDAEETAEVADGETLGPIERATDLHEQGRTGMALGLLRRIRPDDARYEEAQELIARWENPADTEVEPDEDALAPETAARRERLLEGARAAYQQRELVLARQLLNRAGRIAALEDGAAELQEATAEELAPLAAELALFEAGDYERLLPRLWRLYEEDPGNRDVRRMMVTSYYNRGVRQLQRGDPGAAATELGEAVEIDPDDEELRRHYLFAQTYESRPRDLLYRIYVKYLPTR